MFIIVNRLSFKPDVDWRVLASKVNECAAVLKGEPGFVSVELVRLDGPEGFLIVRFTDRENLNRISSEIAGPWFAANLRQYLGGPANRTVGEVVAGG